MSNGANGPWPWWCASRGNTSTARSSRRTCKGLSSCGRINKWAIPKQFKFVAEIPKTSVGKINKKLIREQELV